MADERTFGQVVKARRREMGLTQDELARRVGCAPVTLRKIEYDDLRPSVQIAERLAMAFNIALEERAGFVRLARVERAPWVEPEPTPAPRPDEIGAEDLSGRAIRGYALGDRIGAGGMGVVYRAVQPLVEREVAIKIILPKYANEPEFIRRFEAEAQLVARLEHPHIVPLYDYWRESGAAYLVMRLLRAGSVQMALQSGPLPLEIALRMLEQIGSALAAAHRAGVVHRDLKPANILLDEDANAYVADFGIAKNLSHPNLADQTQADALIGSPDYMSPEQIRSEFVRPQTDIYCLGVMLYEFLTATVPFRGPTPIEVMHQHLTAPLPPLAAHRAGLPAALDAVIARATAKDPLERYPDVGSLLEDARVAVEGQRAVGARPRPVVEERPLTAADNPYKGLRAFAEADAADFFGREGLIQQVLVRLGEGGDLARFLAVVGPSGSGKSSVVKAGLVPALRRGALPGSDNWFVVVIVPGAHPLEELEAALLRVAVNPPGSLLAQLREDKRGLLRAVRRCLPADPGVELVLIIDQFEEVFTLVQDEAARAHFLDSLVTAALDERSRVRLIVTLRADFTDRPLRYVDFGELMRQRCEFVLPLTPDEMEQAIAGPAERAGLELEPGLAAAILRDVADQPGALPLLQYALTALFEHRLGRLLTREAYAEIGGALGALGRRAEEVYASLEVEGRAAARQLFLRLVTPGEGVGDTRRRVLQAELEALDSHRLPADDGSRSAGSGKLSAVARAFDKSRLLTFDRDPVTRGPTMEVAHEALLREWPRLREWLDTSRADIRLQRQLAAAEAQWQAAGREASFLLAGSRLAQFEGWAAETSVGLTQDERAFLEASVAERERQRAAEQARQQRELEAAQKLAETESRAASQLRRRAVLLTGALVLAIILAGAAFLFSRQATANAKTAQEEQQVAFARELSASAISNLSVDPERSILLSLEAVNTSRQNGKPVLVEAEEALHRSVQSSRVLATLRGHSGGIWSLALNHDGTRLATTSQDGTANVWDLATGRILMTLPTQVTDNLIGTGAAFSPDGTKLLTISSGNSATLWDLATGNALFRLTGHSALVTAVAISADGGLFATASDDTTVKLWDATSGKEIKSLTGHDGATLVLAFSADGKRVYAGSDEDGLAIAWDVASGKELFRFSGQGNATGVDAIAASPDGTRLATGEFDTTARIWDAASGNLLLTLFGHSSQVESVAFSPDGKVLAGASEDGTVKLWDALTGRELLTLAGHTSGVLGVAFSPDGARLYTASRDETVKIWDISPTAGSDWMNLAGHADRIGFVTYSPDGTRLATFGFDGTAKVWDAISGKDLLTLAHGNSNCVGNVSYSPDGSRLVVAGGTEPKILDAANGAEVLALTPFNDNVCNILFSADGKRLAAGSDSGLVRIYDSSNGKILVEFPASPAGIQQIAFSPDGKRLATANNDGATVWDAATGQKLLTFSGHGEGVRLSGIAFSPDGKLIATAGNDAAIRVWDSETGVEVYTLTGHTGSAFGVAFSPDGKYLATSSVDHTIKIWTLPSDGGQIGQPLTLYGHTAAVYRVAFSPDGSRLATAGRNPIVRIYALNIGDLIAMAKSRLTRTLTDEECQRYLHAAICSAVP